MANYFDQYDSASGSNHFDQYDTASPPDISSLGPQVTPNPSVTSSSAEPSLAEQIGTAELMSIPGVGPILNSGKIAGAVGKAAEWLGVPHQTVANIGENISGALEPSTLMGIPGVGPMATGIENVGVAARNLGSSAEGFLPAASETAPAAAAAERLGSPMPRVITSGSPWEQAGAAAVSQTPVGQKLSAATQATYDAMGKNVQDVTQTLGSGNQAVAGEAARTGLETYIKSISREEEGKLYDSVDQMVSPDVRRPLLATQEAVGKIEARRGNAFQTGVSPAVASVEKAIAAPEGLNYQGVKDLRTSIRGQLDQGLLPGPEAREMQAVYDGLTSDIRATVKKAGGDQAVSAWEEANSKAATMSRVRKSLVKLTNKTNDADIANSIISYASSSRVGDIKQLVRVRDAVPPSVMDDVASVWTSRLGLDNKGNFSPTLFLRDKNKLSTAGQRILMRSADNKKLMGILDDVGELAKKANDMQKYINTSKTAPTAWLLSLPALMYAKPMETIGMLLGGTVMSHLWSKPATAQPTLNWLKAYGMAARYRTAGSTTLLANASKTLALSISKDLNIPQLVPRITQEIQGISPIQAQSQQNQGPGIGNQ